MAYPDIIATPGVCRGKPRIAGTRIKVEMVAEWVVHGGQTPEEVQQAHPHLTLPQIHAALAYYQDHRDEIEASLQEGRRLADDLRAGFPSPLEEKLRSRDRAES